MEPLKPLYTPRDVIRELGGTSAVARLTRSHASAVSSWKKTADSKIPPRHFPTIYDALAKLGYYPVIELFRFADLQQSA